MFNSSPPTDKEIGISKPSHSNSIHQLHNTESPNSSPDPNTTTTTEPKPALYKYTYHSPEAASVRKLTLPTLILPVVYNAILMWACLSLFFGSLMRNNEVGGIGVVVVDLDQGDGAWIGKAVVGGIWGSEEGGGGLMWGFGDGEEMGTDTVRDEKAWAVLEVSPNASSNLLNALETGNPTYDPLSALTLYYASARNQMITMSLAVPAVMGLINPILGGLAVNSTASFLEKTKGNETAIATALRCPQCLAAPLGIRSVDLIPFNNAAAFGTLSTGCIFLLTFTFNIFTILRASAETHGHLFRLRSHLFLRTIASLSSYLFLSLMYTFIIMAFSIPLTGHYSSKAAGFMVLWMLNWCTMGACGLVLEAAFTILGMQWAPFGLNIWLIINVSGAFAGFEVMWGVYEYGYGVPFYHSIQATRTILFGTKSHLGLNFGVLIAWMVVGLGAMYAATAWRVRKGLRTGVHKVP